MRWGFTSGGQGKNAGREKPSFFSWAEMKGRGIPLAEAASLPSSPCPVPGCPGPGSSCSPPFPSRLSLFPAVWVSCACLQQQRDGPMLCRCVQGGVLPPQAWRQAASPRGAARRGCGTSPSSGAGLCPSPGAVPWSTHRSGPHLLTLGRCCGPTQAVAVSPTFCLGWWLSG